VAIGEWNPEGSTSSKAEVDMDLLQKFERSIPAPNAEQQEIDANSLLTASEKSAGAVMMTLDKQAWDCVIDWNNQQLENLIRFFTVAEMQLPGWEGGNKSPVIALVKILKSRDAFSADLRRWIKANTDNRYLPHGSAL
jgi:hypothetical protein